MRSIAFLLPILVAFFLFSPELLSQESALEAEEEFTITRDKEVDISTYIGEAAERQIYKIVLWPALGLAVGALALLVGVWGFVFKFLIRIRGELSTLQGRCQATHPQTGTTGGPPDLNHENK